MAAKLPEHFERDLIRNVQLISQHALPESPNVDGVSALVTEVRSVFESAIGSVCRAYNSKHSGQHRLSDELWRVTWAFLPMDSLISVSQVCHPWRSVARSCPRLWCALEFRSAVHSEYCACSECPNPSTSLSNSPIIGTSNLNAIISILPLSYPLLFILRATVSVELTELDFVYELAKALVPHSQRIVGIHFISQDAKAVTSFFRFFRELPQLRSLVVKCRDDGDLDGEALDYDSDDRDSDAAEMRMPSLKRMTVNARLGVEPVFSESLKVLHCPYVCANDALAHLEQAPNLEHLQFRFPDRSPDSHPYLWQDTAGLTDACARVPRVEVLNISETTMKHATHLLSKKYQDLVFSYATASRHSGLSLLTTIVQPTHLSIVRRRESGKSARLMMATTDGVHQRTLWLPYQRSVINRGLTDAWNALRSFAGAPEATIDLALLPFIPQHVAAVVTSLVVKMPPSAVPPQGHFPCFSVLQTVEFRIDRPHPPAQYQEITIFAIAQSLLSQPGRRLRSIVLHGISLNGGGSLISRIVDEVVHSSATNDT